MQRSVWWLGLCLVLGACGTGDDEGYCVGPYGASLDRWGVPAYEGDACAWADKMSCDDAGGAWVDFVDTAFDYDDDDGEGIEGYCAAEGFPTDCGRVFVADGQACP